MQTGNGLQQFLLAAAGDTGYAQDLAAVGGKVYILQHMGTLFVAHGQVLHSQPLLWVLRRGALNVQINFFAHHHFGQGLLRGVLGGYIAHILALAQNHHPVGNFQYLMKFMGDDDNGLTG